MADIGLRCLIPFCVVAFVCSQSFNDTGSEEQYRVELDIFSGRQNPSWVIDKSHPSFTYIDMGFQTTPSARPPVRLGYRGFHIESTDSVRQQSYKYIGAGINSFFETMLLESSPTPLHADIRNHVMDNMRGSTTYHETPARESCSLYIEPNETDFSLTPRFDPFRWNHDRHIKKCNNCYNYATQRMTNTFAQPGRNSSGHVCHNVSEITAECVLAAALHDGFSQNFTELEPNFIQTSLPYFSPLIATNDRCIMALVIWPEYDFHWYRLDANLLWSHKPGSTSAVNYDNSGNLISDPRQADRGGYTIFAGFLRNFWGPNIS